METGSVVFFILLSNVFLSTATSNVIQNCMEEEFNTGQLVNCNDIELRTINHDQYPLNITSIEVLYLRNTELAVLDETVFNSLTSLTLLDLASNKLKTLPRMVFLYLKNLLFLDLSNNKISHISEYLFESQANLRYLHLQNNRIRTITQKLLNPLNSLRRVNLDGNPFQCNCDLKEVILWCDKNCLQTNAECEMFTNHPNPWRIVNRFNCTGVNTSNTNTKPCTHSCLYTEELKLMDCKNVELYELYGVTYPLNETSISSLSLSNTKLQYLPHAIFNHLPSLKYLDLSYNNISNINFRVLRALKNLEYLDLSYNNIDSFPDTRIFESQDKLYTLKLDNNDMRFISNAVLKQLVSLKHLSLRGNVWDCNSQLIPVIDWCEEQGLITNAVCSIPGIYTGHPWRKLKDDHSIVSDSPQRIDARKILIVFMIILIFMFIIVLIACYVLKRLQESKGEDSDVEECPLDYIDENKKSSNGNEDDVKESKVC